MKTVGHFSQLQKNIKLLPEEDELKTKLKILDVNAFSITLT